MRNLAAKVPEDLWPDFKARAQAAYQAPSRAIARDLAAGLVADYEKDLPSAVTCFQDDFEACIAHLRLPVTHRRATRPTNQIGRASCRERVCQYVSISGVGVSLKNNTNTLKYTHIIL